MNNFDLLNEAADALQLSRIDIFRRAYTWYHAAIGTNGGTKDYAKFEQNGEIPHYVPAYCQAVIQTGRREQYVLFQR